MQDSEQLNPWFNKRNSSVTELIWIELIEQRLSLSLPPSLCPLSLSLSMGKRLGFENEKWGVYEGIRVRLWIKKTLNWGYQTSTSPCSFFKSNLCMFLLLGQERDGVNPIQHLSVILVFFPQPQFKFVRYPFFTLLKNHFCFLMQFI